MKHISRNNSPQSSNFTRWKLEFALLVIVTALLSGLAYLFQNYIFDDVMDLSDNKRRLYYNSIRAFRMTALYVMPAIWFSKRWGGNINSFGIIPRKDTAISNTIYGVGLYSIAIVVFVKYEIFFSGWEVLDWNYVWLNFALVAVMASITDFWTRGFILFELSRKTNDYNAIFWQNVTWFVIHVYEIELLQPYIGLTNAIMLTLVLGIGGDLIALRTESIFGLMIGHICLNLSILLTAKEVIVLN